MFEPLPEHAPHMAGKWITFIGIGGGIAGVAVAGLLAGEQALDNNVILFGSFGVGVVAGVVLGWRIVMPRSRTARPEE